MTMPLDPEAVRRVDERLANAGIDRGARLIVLHVSAGNPFRRWPASSFAAAAATLASEDPSRRIIITSGPSESAAAESVAGEARRSAGAAALRIVRTASVDLAELGALSIAPRFISAATGGAARRGRPRARDRRAVRPEAGPSDRCRGAIGDSARSHVERR